MLSLEEAKKVSQGYKVVPLAKELIADIRTPMEVLRILKGVSSHVYMLESVENQEKWGRYTFLGFEPKFCIAAKSEKGEFYTPGNIVELMTEIVQPYTGSVFDPACGSGGMFVQSAEFIKRHKGNKKNITIYGQESNDKTYKLARMNHFQ